MESLNFVNLLQSAIIAVAILGGGLLWQHPAKELRGIALFLLLTAFAAVVNILEETGISRDIYLLSPVFIMLFGPATYLAVRLFIEKTLARYHFWHFAPVLPLMLLTSKVYLVIAIGTVWRLVYAAITVKLLLDYKQKLDEQRSDSDEHSLAWLIWLIGITAAFNLVDLIRLNLQMQIPYQLNVLGQGMNTAVWLIAAMLIIYKLLLQGPTPQIKPTSPSAKGKVEESDYHSLFCELDALVKDKQWFLTPRLTLLNISELTGLQTRDISRAINLSAQKSFNEYINGYRIDYVCQQLQTTKSQSLTELANEAGFSSKATFNKVFKQVTGITPSQFKQQSS